MVVCAIVLFIFSCLIFLVLWWGLEDVVGVEVKVVSNFSKVGLL
jgi:hypothetical protein